MQSGLMPAARRAILFPYTDTVPGPAMLGAATGWKTPQFLNVCVCCNGPANGNTGSLFARRAKQETSLTVPVCKACEPHALYPSAGQPFSIIGLMASIGVGALAYFDPGELPGNPNPRAVLIGSIAAAAACAGWAVFEARKGALPKDTIHYADLELDLGARAVILRTSNEALADALLKLNPEATTPPPSTKP